MSELTVRIKMDNAAFFDGDVWAPGSEAARLLRGVAERVEEASGLMPAEAHVSDMQMQMQYRLMDVNGNTVGEVEVTP